MAAETASRGGRTNARRRTQAERTALSDRRIVRAAIGLIARKGYSKTTLAEIGRAAGYSGGLVSHRFGSKLGLLQALVARMSRRFYEDQMEPAVGELSGLPALCATVDTYLGELVAREERMRALYVLMGEALGPVSEIGEVFAELNRGFRASAQRLIDSGIESGEIRADVDAAAEAAALIGTLRGVGLQWMADPECFDLDAVREAVKQSLRRQLAAQGGTSHERRRAS